MTGLSRKRKASEVQSPALASQRSMRGRHSQPGDTEEQEEAEASDEAGKNGEEEVKRPTSAYVHEHIDDIEPYMNIANWEDQVQEITTVERKPNTKKLIVYMVMCVFPARSPGVNSKLTSSHEQGRRRACRRRRRRRLQAMPAKGATSGRRSKRFEC